MASSRAQNQQHSHVFAKPSAVAKVVSSRSTHNTITTATRSALSAVANLDTTARTKGETGRVEVGTAKLGGGGRGKDVVRIRTRGSIAAANRSSKVVNPATGGREDDESKTVKAVVTVKTKTGTTRVPKTTAVSQYGPLNKKLTNKQDCDAVTRRTALACVNTTKSTTAGATTKAQALKKAQQVSAAVVVSRLPQVVELAQQSNIRKTDGRYVSTRSRRNGSDAAGVKVHGNTKAKENTTDTVCSSSHQLTENATLGIVEQKSKLALHQNRGSQLEERHSTLPEDESGARHVGRDLVPYTPQADIDLTEDPSLCGEYAGDIYTHHRNLEEEGHYLVGATFLDHQKDITRSHRRVLVDWLVQVHYKYHLLQETMLLTVDILDRYLQVHVCVYRYMYTHVYIHMYIECTLKHRYIHASPNVRNTTRQKK